MKKATLTTALCAAAMAIVAIAGPAAGDTPSNSLSLEAGSGAHASALGLHIDGVPDPDDITLTVDASHTQYVLTSTHPFNPPPAPCTQASTFEIHCPVSDFASFDATLLDGNDTFTVGPSVKVTVVVAGQAGLDDLIGGGGADRLIGGDAADRLVGNKGQDTLLGGNGRDVLNGGDGRDVLKGGKGNDKLRGGPGRDTEKQ